MRIFSLLTIATLVAANAFGIGVPDDNERHWNVDFGPQYVHEKMTYEVDTAGEKVNFKGGTYGVHVNLCSIQEDSWHFGVMGDWHTGKLKSDISTAGGSTTDKFTNNMWSCDFHVGHHFSMGQDLLDVGITPLVGIGYDYQRLKIADDMATTLAIVSPEYTRGFAYVGFLSNYNCNEYFSIGLNANLRASFSSKVKDKTNQFEVDKLKNVVNGNVEVPLGFHFKTASSQMLDSLTVMPFYNRADWGKDKAHSTELPKMTNKEYGVRLELELYF